MRCVRAPVVFAALFFSATLSVPSLAADATPPAPPGNMMSAQERADQQAIKRELRTNAPYQLDLGNPLHYRLILEILKRGGETPQKSPEFFRLLERGHGLAVARLRQLHAAPPMARPLLVANQTAEPVNLN
jgi:hypothetical protein